jgi:predicted porin
MNKKLLIAAVGAALVAGPMMAAQAAPTVYGSFHMSLDRYDNGKDTTSSGSTERGIVNSNSSRFGIKGDEDLGGGLKSIYQVEGGVFAADDGTSGFGNTLRNTYVGFTGSSWGAVKLGRYDTPVKELGRAVDQFNEQVGDIRNIIGNSTVANVNTTAFDQRVSNMLRYDSANYGGVAFALQYSTPEVKTATRSTSGNVTFTQGPLYVGLGYEKHLFSSSTLKDENDMRLVGKYSMGDLVFSALYETMSDLAGTSGADRKTWGIGGGYKMANNMFKLHYYKTDKVDGQTAENGAKMWALGVDHSFSKTTMAYFTYAKVDNDSGTFAFNPSSSNGGHGTTNVPVAGANGASPKAYSLGTIIKF